MTSWAYLTPEQRSDRLRIVEQCLTRSESRPTPEFYQATLDLLVDTLTQEAYSLRLELQQQALSNSNSPLSERKRESENMALTTVAGAAAVKFRMAFVPVVQQQRNELHKQAIIEVYQWWQNRRQERLHGDANRLLRHSASSFSANSDRDFAGRSASRIASYLTFRRIKEIADAAREIPPTEVPEWWTVTAVRSVRRILVPKLLGGKHLRRSPLDTRQQYAYAHRSISKLLDAAKSFTFDNIEKAHVYFANALVSKFSEMNENYSHDIYPGSGQSNSSEPPSIFSASALEAGNVASHESNPEYQVIKEEEGGDFPFTLRERIWNTLCEHLETRNALKFWVLLALRAHAREYKEIAQLVRQPRCKILTPDDLPPWMGDSNPDQAFADIHALFEKMDTGSKDSESSDKLPGALRVFWHRSCSVLRDKNADVEQLNI